MKVFDFSDYKEFLFDRIAANKTNRGYQSRLATAAGCSRSFLSQVLGSEVDITRDHAAGLCDFWGFDETEFEYFLTLVDLARAKSEKLRARIVDKLKSLRAKSKEANVRLGRDRVTGIDEMVAYYSTWLPSAVHVLLTCPSYRVPRAIAQRLGVSIGDVEKVLGNLARMGLAERKANEWRTTKTDINLPEAAALSAVNHANWRHKAITNIQNRSEGSVHYSSVFTMSVADAEKIREILNETLSSLRKTIIRSPEEELYCFNADFFRVR